MKTSKDLFDIMRDKAGNQTPILGKWREYTFQYESGLGFTGLNSRLTVWCYNYTVCVVTCKQLTVNDERKVKSEILENFHMSKLIDAIEEDETIAISNLWLLWRITLGGYMARKWASKGNRES